MQHARRSLIAAAALLAVVLTAPARAQLLGLNHVWTIPGVINGSGSLGTFIACTNANSASATIGVDVYGSAGAASARGSGCERHCNW